MLEVGKKIKQRREELGMSQEELAKKTGYKSRSSINKIERGGNSLPQSKIVTFAVALDTTPSYLLGWENKSAPTKPPVKLLRVSKKNKSTEFSISISERKFITKYRTLDKYGKDIIDTILDKEHARCTAEQGAITISLPRSTLKASAGTGDWLGDEGYERIDVLDTPEARKATLVIEVDGDSMEPDFSDGDLVLVNTNAIPETGDIGIFVVNGDGFIKQASDRELISLNSEYDNIKLNDYDSVYTMGVVVGKAEIER